MAEQPKNPHDAYFRHVMSEATAAADEMRNVLPEAAAAQLDWDGMELQSCSFVPKELRSRYTDVLFRTRWDDRDAFVFMLIEHQSSTDQLMAFRMLEYTVAIWNRYLRHNPKARRLPVVIPVVVHCDPGGYRWNAPTELSDLLDVDQAMRPVLGECLPRFRFLLDDLGAADIAALRARKLSVMAKVLFVSLKIGPGNPRLGHDLLPLEAELRMLIEDYPGEFDQVMAYLWSVGKTDVAGFAPLIDRLGPRAKEIMMTTAEQFRTEGRAEGRTEGRAEALLDQLVVKFGVLPERVIGIVRGADATRLRVWGARVLTADSLDEVFAD
ncbi:Rpn family recombination-promoting nuclease/putative transposase [Nocardia yamanashiensis]|uniref:Rpn family recombination-promoting nuclease/putative transposase n=1 Tax=Nocardia yamanashiensis TaxID=209247 RepID=UPI001E5336A3|nr:Rpn family recombination-promoting nuclease/putative transposase [Nocardia yamanashiensis]UGT42803.1 Rpn family recombination-promoting nuclease/putative transposase [Nocardia yamanashiensis]